jgi:CheY-like chemotaxis protein
MSEAKTILLVDDDPDFVTSIKEIVESGGYKTLTAFDGRACLESAKKSKPDLILLDVMMAERDEGFKVLQEIRETPAIAAVPVILVSSIYTDLPAFKVMPEAGRDDADLFLPKPVDPKDLLQQIARLLKEGRQTPARKR